MQYFSDELLPYFGIKGKVVGFAPTELVKLELHTMYQDFNLIMDDGSWNHFEFQSTNEGLAGLKRFRVYEASASYQHKTAVTTYVLFSGKIKNPMTEFSEGCNTYRIIPIIMQDRNADKLLGKLQKKQRAGHILTPKDMVPLTLCLLMSGKTSLTERVKAAYDITKNAAAVPNDDILKVEAVIYAMANKFLDSMDMNKIREVIRMTKLGQMLRDEGIALGKEQGIALGKEQGIALGKEQGIALGKEQGKLDMVKKLLLENLLEPEQIARITDLPLETILQMKQKD